MAITAAQLRVEVGADTRDAEAGIKKFDRSLDTLTSQMTRSGAGLTAALTVPLVGIATAALDSAAGFEQSLNILQQVTDASVADMSALTEQALQLGAVTSFSAGEAAEGMLELGKAGMDTNEIMASIPGVMDLAAAGGIALAEAANITATTLNAFGLEASESARIADLLAGAANASSADISDLAKGVQNAGFAFAAANWPVEDLATSLAILTNVGLTGSDASTALKNAIMQMISPTQQAADLAKELGISFFDAQGAMLSLPAILTNLNTAFAGMTDEQRNAALATLFMSDGMKAMIPLLDQGASGFNATKDVVTEFGAASQTANARMQGLRGGIEYLRGSIDSFLIGAAMPFLNTLSNLARGAGDALTAFGELPQPIIDASLAFAGVLAAAGPLMLTLAGLAKMFAFMTGPVGAVVVAVGALAAAWAADVGGIQAITASTFSAVQQWFTSTLTSAQQVGQGIANAFGNTKFPSLQTLWEQFKAGDFQTLATTIRNTAFELMVNLDAELDITGKADQLKQQLVGVVNSLTAALTSFGSQITGSFELDLSGASQKWSQSMSSLATTINNQDWSQFGSNLVKGIGRFLSGDVSGLEDFANNFAASVRGAIATADWGDLNQSFSELAVAVRGAIYEIFGGIGKELTPMISSWNEQFSSAMVKLGADIRASIASTFASWNTEFSTALESLGAAIRAQIANIFSGLLASLGIAAGGGEGLGSVGGAFPLRDYAGGEVYDVGGKKGRPSMRPPAESAAMDIPPVEWDTYIKPLDWATYVTEFVWDTYIMPVQWNSYVEQLAWDSYVSPLEWASYVTSLVWDSFVPRLDWGSFVTNLSWSSYVSDLSWGNYVTALDWARFIPQFTQGPSSSESGQSAPVAAASVGAAGRGDVHIHFENVTVANDIDIHSLANKLMREIQRNTR